MTSGSWIMVALIAAVWVYVAWDVRRIRRREREERGRFELSCDEHGRSRTREDQRVEVELLRAPARVWPVELFVSSRRHRR